jgi:hypothetical protein
MIEAVTDAAVGLATGNSSPLGWYDQANGEIGDICNAEQGQVAGYTVQKEWSNSQGACILTNPNATTGASSGSTGTSGSGTTTSGGTTSSGSTSSGSTGSSGSSGSTGSTALQNGVPVTGLSAATNAQKTFTFAVPAGATNLNIAISGGTGDADLYVKFGSAPTLTSYDCRPYVTGNSESCPIPSPSAGTYYVMINAYQTYSGLTLTASYSAASGTTSSGTTSSGSTSSGSTSSGSTTGSSSGSTTGTSGSTSSGSTGGTGGNALTNGVPKTNLSGATNSQQTFTFQVPAGASNLTFAMSGGTGDADLYVKFGSAPTLSSYDCRPYVTGNNENCNLTAQAGTYYVMINGYQAYSGLQLVASYSTGGTTGGTSGGTSGGGGGGGSALQNGVPVTGVSGATNSQKDYTFAVPSGASQVTIAISGGTGDADLYVKFGSAPSLTTYDCRPYVTGNNETCTLPAQAGTYYIMLNGYQTYSGVTLSAKYQ